MYRVFFCLKLDRLLVYHNNSNKAQNSSKSTKLESTANVATANYTHLTAYSLHWICEVHPNVRFRRFYELFLC
jgi:hypothetical protein